MSNTGPTHTRPGGKHGDSGPGADQGGQVAQVARGEGSQDEQKARPLWGHKG